MNEHPSEPGYGQHPRDVAELRQRLQHVETRIAAACQRVGRAASSVRLLPVTKTLDIELLRMAYAIGCRDFGENKPQELARKAAALADLTDLKWSLIGHLQTNKAKLAARYAHAFHALDSLRVATALERRLQAAGRSLPVLVQVNSSGEASKFGLEPAAVADFVRQLAPFQTLKVCGLMTLALHSSDAARVRPCFVTMRQLRDRLRQSAPDGMHFDTLSMGMSSDFEWAIEEGATVVRVGQAIFGTRAVPDSYYWPISGARG